MLFHYLVYLLPALSALAPAFAAPAPVDSDLATVAARDTCVPGKHYVSIRPQAWTKVSSLYSPNEADHYDVKGGTGTAVRPLFFDPAVGYTMERCNLATFTPKVPGISWEETLRVWDSSTPYADTIYDVGTWRSRGPSRRLCVS